MGWSGTRMRCTGKVDSESECTAADVWSGLPRPQPAAPPRGRMGSAVGAVCAGTYYLSSFSNMVLVSSSVRGRMMFTPTPAFCPPPLPPRWTARSSSVQLGVLSNHHSTCHSPTNRTIITHTTCTLKTKINTAYQCMTSELVPLK